MKRIFLSALPCALLLAASPASAAPSWSGRYVYEEYAGRTAGGTAIVVTHELQLWKSKKGWEGKLESNGYQTFIDLICRGEVKGNKFTVKFARRGSSILGSQYKNNDVLFDLEHVPYRGKTSLITQWKKFKPVALSKYSPRGAYFKRQ